MSIDTTVMPSQDSNPTCFNPSSHIDTLTCCICLGLLNRPVQLSCDNLICANCCCESIRQSHSLDCPCCNTHTLSQSTISKPSAIVLSFLNEVIVSCIRGYNQAVKVHNYEHHLAGDCKGFYEDFNSPSKVTLGDVLSKPATLPTTEAEMKATSHLVRRVMNQQECTSQASSVVPFLLVVRLESNRKFSIITIITYLIIAAYNSSTSASA